MDLFFVLQVLQEGLVFELGEDFNDLAGVDRKKFFDIRVPEKGILEIIEILFASIGCKQGMKNR